MNIMDKIYHISSKIQECHYSNKTEELSKIELIEVESNRFIDTDVEDRMELLREHLRLHRRYQTLTPQLEKRFFRSLKYLATYGGYYSELKLAREVVKGTKPYPRESELKTLAYLERLVPYF